MRPTSGPARILLLATTCLSACAPAPNAIIGSGASKQEARTVGPFTGVELSGALKADVRVGPEGSVVVEADDNILPLVRTEVRDGRLAVGLADGVSIRPKVAPRVTIVTPTLDHVVARGASTVEATASPSPRFAVEAEGASTATIRGLSSDVVEVKAHGAAKVHLAGGGKRLKLDVAGASNVRSGDAPFEAVEVRVEGASGAEVNASGTIAGVVSGASSLKDRGEPRGRKVEASGASSVTY